MNSNKPPTDSPPQEGTLMPWEDTTLPPAPPLELLPPQALAVLADVLAFLDEVAADAPPVLEHNNDDAN